MKKVAMFLFLGLMATVASGYVFVSNYGEAGSGISKTVTRELETFNEISLEQFGTVNVGFGDVQSVTVTTDENLIDLVETVVVDGELRIRPTKAINPRVDLVIEVTVPALAKVELAGAASLNIIGIEGDSLDIELAGACGVDATGSVKDLSVEMAGACRARLKSLEAENANVEIAGTGSAVVFASKKLDAEAAGFASITCHGNPEEVKKEASGISSVTIAGG